MSSAVIVGFKRSPFTISRKGGLANARPEDILSQVINDLVISTKINKNDIRFKDWAQTFYKEEVGAYTPLEDYKKTLRSVGQINDKEIAKITYLYNILALHFGRIQIKF